MTESRRHSVLVVDDEPDILGSISMLLEEEGGIEVYVALSGAEGLSVLEERDVDVIISDYKMPGMNGLEFLHLARRAAPRAERILMTAFPDLQLALRAINEQGVKNVIVKPFDPQDVIDSVSTILVNIRAADLQTRAFARALHAIKEVE